MNTTRLLPLAAVALLCGSAFVAVEAKDESASNVTVQFLEPENYTDFKTTFSGTTSERERLTAELTKAIERTARHDLPPGYRLALTVRDVDLAGDINPGFGPGMNDVRRVTSVYPPRIKLEFAITDPDGNVVSTGEQVLTDLAFDWQTKLPSADYTVYEQKLLVDFVRDLGRKLAKS